MEVRLLGPVEASGPDGPAALGGARQRAVLAMLALAAPRVVSTDLLIDGIWGETPPAKPLATLQVFVHNLRKALRAVGIEDAVRYQAPGYVLGAADIDVARFHALFAQGRSARTGEAAAGLRAYDEALALWRGEALSDLHDLPFVPPEAVRLEEERLQAVEERLDVALALGRHAHEVADLETLVRAHPTRERLIAHLMTALYRSDRQADALETFAQARERLADELGIDPGAALRQLELSILRQDPDLTLSVVPVPVPAPAFGPERKAEAAPRPRGQIPSATTKTIGREELIEQVLSVLSRPDVKVVSLTGLGGSGKSRVAAAAAEEARLRALFETVGFLTVTEAVEPEQLTREIGLLLDADESQEPLAALAELSALGSPLLVLDNLESLDDAPGFVTNLVAVAPYLTLLITSRVGLRLNAEHGIFVPPLTTPPESATPEEIMTSPAAQMFTDRVRATSAESIAAGSEPVVGRIVRMLDGVPLALELAAGQVRLLGLEGVERDISSSLAVLTSRASDLPERHRTLEGTIQWSYDRLSEPARVLCDRLALFERGFTLDAIEAVCADLPDVVGLLGDILDARMIRTVPARVGVRFVVLGTVRAFALNRLASYPDVGERRRDLAIFLLDAIRLLTPYGPDTAVDIARFDEDAPDLEASIRWAVDTGDHALAAQLVTASLPWWMASSRAREGQALAARARAHLTRDDAAYLPLTLALAQLTYDLTDWSRAAEEAATARDLAEQIGDESSAAIAACYLGGALVVTGKTQQGAELARGAYETAERHGLYPLSAIALSVQAIACALSGDFDGEREHYEQRLAVARDRGDNARIADTLNTLAEIAIDEEDPESAYDFADSAREIAGVAFAPEARDATITLARAALASGRTDDAARLLAEALPMAEHSGQALATAQCLRVAATLANGSNQADLAVRLFAAAQLLSPSPNGTEVPVEADFAAALTSAQDALGPRNAQRAWTLGVAKPWPQPRDVIRTLIDVHLPALSTPAASL